MAKLARKHILIPKHAKLSDKEKSTLLDRYEVTVGDLPSIKADDTALVEMAVEEGDVIKVERDSPTAGKTVFYRGVTNV